MLRLLRN